MRIHQSIGALLGRSLRSIRVHNRSLRKAGRRTFPAVLWAFALWMAMGTVSFAGDATVSQATASALSTAVTTANSGGGTITFQIPSGGTITTSSSVSLTNAVSFVNSGGAVTISLGSNSLNLSSAGTVSLGSDITWQGTQNVVTSTTGMTFSSMAGTISTTSTGMSNAQGIYQQGTNAVTFSNGLSGSISATSDMLDAYGIRSTNGDITISSGGMTGDITATGGIDAYGIRGNAVTITGDISSASSITAHGTSFVQGIRATTFRLNGEYAGSIDANSTGGDAWGIYAITLEITGGISGMISATSSSGFASALSVYGPINGGSSDTPLVITGTLEATGTTAETIYSQGAVNVKVDSTGTLSAVSTSGGTANAIDADYDGITHRDSKIELVAGCTVIGNIKLTSGTADLLTLSGTTGSTTLGGNIEGAETIRLTGGTWALDGTITGCNTFEIAGGTVSLNGSNSLNVVVDAGGTLGGNSTVASLTNSGTVAPGNSIGTINVTGNYINNAGSTVRIEISDTGTNNCDKIAVGGTATLHGGTVNVVGGSGAYTSGMTYRFLTATGGVTGTFTSVTDDLAFLDASLLYGLNYVSIVLTASQDYVDEARTVNQRGVAAYLDTHKTGASGDFGDVLSQLNTLNGDQARAAFNAMSGEIHGSMATIALEGTERFMGAVANRLRVQSMTQSFDSSTADMKRSSLVYVNHLTSALEDLRTKVSGWTTWIDSYGAGATIGGDGNASGLTYSTGGLLVGMERHLDDHTVFGFGGGYASSSTTLAGRSDWGSIDGGQACVYMHRDLDSHYVTGLLAYGRNSYNTKRYVDFGTIDRTALADYHGNTYSAYLETGRNLFGRIACLQPFAGLEYIGVQQDSFSETNANSLDLAVNGTTADAMRGLLGLRVLDYFRTSTDRLISLDASVAWRHEFLDDTSIIDAAMIGQPGTAFEIAGVKVDRDAAIVGSGLNYALSDHCNMYANYNLLFSCNYAAHTGLSGIQYTW